MNPNQKNFIKFQKPVAKIIPIVFTGTTTAGVEYDVESCKTIIKDLQNSGCFDKLSVGIDIARKRVVDEEAKGMMTVARLQKYNVEDETVEALFIGKNVRCADLVDTGAYVIVPRVRVARDSTEVVTIIGFEIVLAMEA